MTRILILSANPKDTNRLRLDEEIREIEEGLRRTKHREQFEIVSRWAVRPEDLRRALLDYEPQIVHFSGHGLGDQGLALENHTGNIQPVSSEALAGLFSLFKNKVQCVVLNACYSDVQADAIHREIDYVVGMTQPIGDRAAIEFAIGFYDALGAGRSIEDAFKFGCNAMALKGISQSLTPVLKAKQKDNLNCETESNPPVLERNLSAFPPTIWTRVRSFPHMKVFLIPAMFLAITGITTLVLRDSANWNSSPSNSSSTAIWEEQNNRQAVDYATLGRLLSTGDFVKADEETSRILLQITGNLQKSHNDPISASQIDCNIYKTIDQLWQEASKDASGNSKFGFSIQRRIYQEVGNVEKLGERVGWRKNGDWLTLDNLVNDLRQAPPGHFPSKFRGALAKPSLSSGWMVWSLLPGNSTANCLTN
jgi:hypothetical protein